MLFTANRVINFLFIGVVNTILSFVVYWATLPICGYLTAFYLSFIFSVIFTSTLNVSKVFGSELNFRALFYYIPYYVVYGFIGGEFVKYIVNEVHVSQWIAPFFSLVLLTPLHYICSNALISKSHSLDRLNQDINQLAELQLKNLPNSYISQLGEGFTRAYWRMCYTSRAHFVIFEKDGNKILSFASVSLEPKNFLRDLLLKTPLVFCVIKHMHKKFIWKLIREHLISSSSSSSSSLNKVPNCPEMVILATDSKYRGKGFGKLLVENVESKLKLLGYSNFYIKTEHNNRRAQKFYSALGFRYHSKYIFLGQLNVILLKEINGPFSDGR